MQPPRLQVEQNGSEYVIRIIDRTPEIESRFHQVYAEVNLAETLPKSEQHGPRFQALYNEGPLLFNHQLKHPVTGEVSIELGGLQVSQRRLDATIAKLRELGFEVLH